jgi:hypothetical protein
MPELLWLYLTALLYYRTAASCVALAEALETVSHDRLTRLLQSDWSGQRLLDLTCRTLFVLERGYLHHPEHTPKLLGPMTGQTGPEDCLHQCGLKTTVLDQGKSRYINTSIAARRRPRHSPG